MNYSTPVPNAIFDQYLPYVNQAEVKVLLVVVRQTLGWLDPKTKCRKSKDWISISFFSRKTGLTYKSISIAINSLIQKEMIVALDRKENELRLPKDRRGKKRIYYAYAPYFRAMKAKSKVFNFPNICRIAPKTKETQTKETQVLPSYQNQRQPDHERLRQIQNKRDRNNQ